MGGGNTISMYDYKENDDLIITRRQQNTILLGIVPRWVSNYADLGYKSRPALKANNYKILAAHLGRQKNAKPPIKDLWSLFAV